MKIILNNVARVQHAEVEIKGISVISGYNGTGKSTVCKALYATSQAFKRVLQSRENSIKNSIDEWESKSRTDSDPFWEECSDNFFNLLEQMKLSLEDLTDEDLPKLADSYICDSFFVPDMPVRVQRYSVTGIDEEYSAATAAFVINADSAKTRVLCEKQTGGARLKKGSQASCWVQNGDTITVYIFGELPKEELIWTLYENGACEKVIEGTVSSEFSEMTFKDYALRGYDENSGILEYDWYNAQVELLRLGSEIWGNGLVQIEAGVFSLMRWYEYTITLKPGQTLKNAVTAPLYPSIDADYTPSIYAYTYLLSPAKTWTQFGELNITVNTPYYMTECGIDGFTRTDSGYALTLPGLPEGELTFTLSEAERPQPPKRSILHLMPTELIIVPAAVLVAVAAVFLPARRKRRTKR